MTAAEARQRLSRIWEEGGYRRHLNAAGLERVRHWCEVIAGERAEETGPYQKPFYLPVFPGLRAQAWWEPAGFPWHRPLLALVPRLQAELHALMETGERFHTYFQSPKGAQWNLFPLHYMGTRSPEHACRCAELTALLEALPDRCDELPFSDLTFSLLTPGAHLAAHCSADNLRIRCHAGLRVPGEAWLRVGEERRSWAEGSLLAFDDSFEHEACNPSDGTRAVLIVDFWHPDLSSQERAALRAGLGVAPVRRLFAPFRARPTPQMWQAFEQADTHALRRDFWGCE